LVPESRAYWTLLGLETGGGSTPEKACVVGVTSLLESRPMCHHRVSSRGVRVLCPFIG